MDARQQQRVARYQEIIDRTPAFTEGGLDPSKVDETLAEIREIKSRQTGRGTQSGRRGKSMRSLRDW